MTSTFTPPAPLQTAVLLLVFNRPDTTAQVFEAIRKAKPLRLYVAGDGPREGREGEAERVSKVRAISTAVDWPCEVRTLFRRQNVGCQFGPRGGIDWFFEHEEQGIILEDDCLPSQAFFWFCEEILVRFSGNERVMAVTGTNITQHLNYNADYFFSQYALMWGWASWRRAWAKYDPELSEWKTLRKSKWLKGLKMGGLPFEITWKRTFDRTVQLNKKASWWDYQWIYSCWLNNGLTVVPAKNLIRNIGFSDDATHTRDDHPILSTLQLNELHWPLKVPLSYEPHSGADAFISEHWFGISWKALFKSYILSIPGAKIANQYRKKCVEKTR